MTLPQGGALVAAACEFALRGWPVLPCNPQNKEPLVAADRDAQGRPVRGTGGVSAATTDPALIRDWWGRWPRAAIGLAMGRNGCFALDFDPRVDAETGEVFDLKRLKAETEAQLRCALPATLAAHTPSGGVHLYLRQPADGGAEIRNRGNLPRHVDVRGAGGYVIAPPSVMADGRGYRWLRGMADAPIAEAPAALVEVLRARGAQRPRPSSATGGEDRVGEAVRKYALSALDGECRDVRAAGSGMRNARLNAAALKIASLVSAGALDAGIARASLEAAARDNPGRDSDAQLIATIDSGWTAGMQTPRDLGEVASAARSRERPGGARAALRVVPSSPAPGSPTGGTPSSRPGGGGANPPEWGPGGNDDDAVRRCAMLPQTDLGNLQRFLARHGGDFLYVEAWGWLVWDGRRWDRDLALPRLGRAVQRTVRAIQDEAKLVRDSGDVADGGLDKVVKVGRDNKVVLLSDTIAAWGRTSEAAGHIRCLPGLAEARLAARVEDFDADPLLLNLENGTLAFARPAAVGGAAKVDLREHRRGDRITKMAAAAWNPEADCPQFDRFLEQVQPDADMRAFLDVWGGYNALGLADAQKMALFYGGGSNGKGVWINTVAHILGDYAWAAAIETFIDQGKYRKGSDASPDLAALAGRRMVYANEPEENSKFSDGLIKTLTSDEPIGGVRELNKPPFQLQVTFSNTVSANNHPRIGNDYGIQRRMQVVPWDVTIPKEQVDIELKAKLRTEASGVLNRLVAGAVQYLTSGLPLPEAIVAATREYHAENDLLGQFIDLCTRPDPGGTVGARDLHDAFAGWQAWSGNLPATGKPWSQKYLNAQMRKKKFVISKSSTMRWHDLRLLHERSAFVDSDGRPRTDPLPEPAEPPRPEATPDGPPPTEGFW